MSSATTKTPQYGILLPHFGRHATAERIRMAGPAIEGYGFDSVWVRDHVVQQPHGHEDPNVTFIDAFVTLSTIGALTERLRLCSAVLIPHRHPVLLAMMLGSLDFVSGGGRVIAGVGVGNWNKEFEAIGQADWDRKEMLAEYVEIVRKLWSGESVSHEGTKFAFEDVMLSPVPAADQPVPIWYGGNSAAAVRRSVEYCDGWVASRMPRRSLAKRMKRLRRLSDEAGRPLPEVGVVPYVSPADTVEAGLARVNVPALLEDLTKLEPPPPSGSYSSVDDIDGAVIAGPPEVIVEEVRAFQEPGVEHFVFDLRPCLDEWEEQLAVLGEQVLPLLHDGDGRNRTGDGPPGSESG